MPAKSIDIDMDMIRIEQLQIYAYHGVFEEERKQGQDFYVNAALYLDTRKAGLNDDLTLSVHYGEVAHFISNFIKQHVFLLIETIAEQVTQALLLQFPLIQAIDLEIRKPDAPIGLPFESVSVKITRGWKKAYVALGSNMGARETYIADAITALRSHEQIKNIRVSSLRDSTPYGMQQQDNFLNGALCLETLLPPAELLAVLQQLEQAAGRVREVPKGPRTLDLDILLYEDVIMDLPELTIPHYDMHNRDFVLMPLMELSPYLQHPVLHKSIQQLLQELKDHYMMES